MHLFLLLQSFFKKLKIYLLPGRPRRKKKHSTQSSFKIKAARKRKEKVLRKYGTPGALNKHSKVDRAPLPYSPPVLDTAWDDDPLTPPPMED
jgi:hypothetical protein